MSQILRIQGHVFHIPSVARTRLYATTWLKMPRILIINHNGLDTTLAYSASQWDQAKRDYKKMEESRAACYEALKVVPLMEETLEYNPLVESEKPLR